MSKYIYVVTVTGKQFENKLDLGFIDLCLVFTNKERAIEYAKARSLSSSFFERSAVYRAQLYNYSSDYLEIIDAYEKGIKIYTSAE